MMLRASTVAQLRKLAHAARAMEVGDSHDLLGVSGRLHPLEIAELCDTWREHHGIVRRRDCTDVRPETVR